MNISAETFRKLVTAGVIPYRKHISSVHRIFLKSDLDDYLTALPAFRGNMVLVEDSPKPTTERRSE